MKNEITKLIIEYKKDCLDMVNGIKKTLESGIQADMGVNLIHKISMSTSKIEDRQTKLSENLVGKINIDSDKVLKAFSSAFKILEETESNVAEYQNVKALLESAIIVKTIHDHDLVLKKFMEK